MTPGRRARHARRAVPVAAATVGTTSRKTRRGPTVAPRTTPLARLLGERPERGRITALDVFELAKKKWLAGERLDLGKLAEELGIGRATVFRWVGSRDQLYGEVISAAFAATIERARRASIGTGAAFLTDITRNLLRALSTSEPLRHFVKQDPELALRIVMSSSSPVEARVVAAVRSLIDAEVAAGHLVPIMDTGSLAYVIVRIAESFLYRDALTGDEPDIATATKAISLLWGQPPRRRLKP